MNKESTTVKNYCLCRVIQDFDKPLVIDEFVVGSQFKDAVKKKHTTATTHVIFTTVRAARTKDIF